MSGAPPSVSAKNKRRLYKLIPTLFTIMIVVIIVVAPIAAKPMENDAWLERIFQFQGLIAGYLAILAAYITIAQMRESEAKADKRHDDLMRLQLAAELRRAERAVNPYHDLLKTALHALREQVENLEKAPNAVAYALANRSHLSEQLRILSQLLRDATFKEGSQLFSGSLSYVIDLVAENSGDARNKLMPERDTDVVRTEWARNPLLVVRLISDLTQVVKGLYLVIIGLEDFAKPYEIELVPLFSADLPSS